ncbi:MAG: VOC family protein [Sphingomonadaceae bacterium]|nr:VOC family protein [Sphingomonadaceae bacterium]
MSMMLGFGQPVGGVMQMAYVVEDIRAAIDFWIRDTGTGPWFLLDRWTGDDPVYRGRASEATVSIAMGFAGHMNIELIRPLDDAPSVYREAIERDGFGFHHLGVACPDVEGWIPLYETRGYTLAFKAGVPTGGKVAYMDGGRDKPGYVELIAATQGMDAAFTRFWHASTIWDGSDPVRPFL